MFGTGGAPRGLPQAHGADAICLRDGISPGWTGGSRFDLAINPSSLVIVPDLYFLGSNAGPPENDPPLVVDADRMSAGKVALKSFEAIAGRNGKIAEVVQPANQVATVTQAAAGFSVGIFLISSASSRSACQVS